MANCSFHQSNVPAGQTSSKEETARLNDGRRYEFWPEH